MNKAIKQVGRLLAIGGLLVTGVTVSATPIALQQSAVPSDVRAGHWAQSAVQTVLQNGVMSLPDGKQFHGEAKVTRTEAVIALAKLAKKLEAGTWQAGNGAPVPTKVQQTLQAGNWGKQPVTRYMLANTLARFGDYIAHGLPHPTADALKNSKNYGQSIILPPKVNFTLAANHPAYASLAYLTKNRMIQPGSPLLKPGEQRITGDEWSHALAQMALGLNDRLTDLGHDENGDTIDVNTPGIKKPNKK